MTLLRMDNTSIVVADLDAAIAFFTELGLKLDGRMEVSGAWTARIVGLEGNHAEIAMMRMPDGHGALELTRYIHPTAITPTPKNAVPNTLGFHRVMFAVDDVRDVVERLRKHGGELVGDIVDYEDVFRLCYFRSPEGFIIGLAQPLKR